MPNVLVFDLDRTLASFPATTRLYYRLLLRPPRFRPAAIGIMNLILMHVFWFVPPAVRFQRRVVMSLFSRVDDRLWESEIERLAKEVVEDYTVDLGKKVAELSKDAEALYLVSHCPLPLAERVRDLLGFDGCHGVEVVDYLRGAPGDVYSKVEVLEQLRSRHPGAKQWFFADDLVDLGGLRSADVGTLVNGSRFSRWVCSTFFPQLRIW